jgi:hypothetical protein
MAAEDRRTCGNCGRVIQSDLPFCGYCGHPNPGTTEAGDSTPPDVEVPGVATPSDAVVDAPAESPPFAPPIVPKPPALPEVESASPVTAASPGDFSPLPSDARIQRAQGPNPTPTAPTDLQPVTPDDGAERRSNVTVVLLLIIVVLVGVGVGWLLANSSANKKAPTHHSMPPPTHSSTRVSIALAANRQTSRKIQTSRSVLGPGFGHFYTVSCGSATACRSIGQAFPAGPIMVVTERGSP